MTKRRSPRALILATLMLFVLSTLLTGCLVRTGSSKRSVRHAHEHCHVKRHKRRRGRSAKKRVCHRHPHNHGRRGDHH